MSMWTFLGVVGASFLGSILGLWLVGWYVLGGRDADE